jgi:S1-C subfamily serine protease
MPYGVYSKEDIEKMHRQILWPTVRIAAEKAWGSGTLIHSKPDKEGKFHSYVLTCHHVVSDNISLKTKFDQRVGFDIKKLVMSPVEVQFFYYENLSICKGSAGSVKADVVAFDEDADIALLELQRTTKVEPVAKLFPKDKIGEVHVFDKVFACGAAMAHEPIATAGMINFLNEEMEEGIEYWMSNAQIIFGNSGGAIFRFSPEREQFEYIGIPARIAVNIAGFSADAITHMGFFVPITRIYNLIDKHFYSFIYDEKETYESCKAKREEYRKKMEQLLVSKYGGPAKKESK